MNQQQSKFIDRAMQQLRHTIDACCQDGSCAIDVLGRKRVGRHIIVVSIVAEIDQGFAAPLSSHASRLSVGHSGVGNSGVGNPQAANLGSEPDYSVKTRHHNKHRANRWHKPIF